MFDEGKYKLYQGDCLEVMDVLISLGVKFDAIITDPPYGATACKWDSVIPFNRYIVIKEGKRDKILYEDEFILRRLKEGINIKEVEKEWKENSKEGMWEKINKLIKTNGAICLFGSEPFSTALRMSNIKYYKYDCKWLKSRKTGFQMVKKRPLKCYEDIMIFYQKQPTYNNTQLIKLDKPISSYRKNGKGGNLLNTVNTKKDRFQEYTNYNRDLLRFNNEHNVNSYHPTQKPVDLLEYLIKTYTNEGDLVLDFTMGSGSTGVACLNTNRNFIGIELNEKYFNIAVERLKNIG